MGFCSSQFHIVSLLEPPSHSSDSSVSDSATNANTVPLASVKAVATYLPYVESARQRVTSDMEQMVISGLRTLVRTTRCFK